MTTDSNEDFASRFKEFLRNGFKTDVSIEQHKMDDTERRLLISDEELDIQVQKCIKNESGWERVKELFKYK